MKHWPTWIEINLSDVKHNVRQIKKRIGQDVCLMLVIKANAYGHGSYKIAKAAAEAGVEKFGVASVDEAITLRENGITQPILILGLSLMDAIEDIVKYDVMATVCQIDWAKMLSDEAVRQNKMACINVKVNTGMNRIGIEPEEATMFVKKIQQYPNLFIEGIFTHLATAYSEKEYVNIQFNQFKNVLENLEKEGIYIPFKHCANTGAVINDSYVYLNQVRPGLIGTTPYAALNPRDGMDIRECFQMKSRVVFIRKVKAGQTAGYDKLYKFERDSIIAVVSAGWADGIPRELTNKGNVIIHGIKCPIRGRVMCDTILVDITNIPDEVKPGDEVVIIGRQCNETISCWEWRTLLGGVSSPVTLRTFVSDRVTRRYIE